MFVSIYYCGSSNNATNNCNLYTRSVSLLLLSSLLILQQSPQRHIVVFAFNTNRRTNNSSSTKVQPYYRRNSTRTYTTRNSSNNKNNQETETMTASSEPATTTTIGSVVPDERSNMGSNAAANGKSKIADSPVAGVQQKTWNPFRLAILRLKMTEPAMTSSLNYRTFDKSGGGTFHCAYCDHLLFATNAKYNSGTGWPSFWRTANENSVSYHREWDGRLECKCNHCDSHLGHVFLDGPRPSSIERQELVASAPNTDPRTTSNQYLPRFCVNGLALTYQSTPSQQTE